MSVSPPMPLPVTPSLRSPHWEAFQTSGNYLGHPATLGGMPAQLTHREATVVGTLDKVGCCNDGSCYDLETPMYREHTMNDNQALKQAMSVVFCT